MGVVCLHGLSAWAVCMGYQQLMNHIDVSCFCFASDFPVTGLRSVHFVAEHSMNILSALLIVVDAMIGRQAC
jgi:hypothetical protein